MIFVITHKIFDDSIIDSSHFKVLHVGENGNTKSDYLNDNTGDNISFKNPHYCELTGQYWVWKNYNEDDDEITGIEHYRRYFTTNREGFLYTYFGVKPEILRFDEIQKLLKRHDIILPKKPYICRSIKQFYTDNHDLNDLIQTRKSIKKLFPEYLNAFDNVMNSHSFYYANMFICKRKLFDEYSSWLFTILEDVEKNIDMNKNGDKYQARVMGFLSERLLQVWVLKNNLRVAERRVFNTEKRDSTIFRRTIWRLENLKKRLQK